MFATPGWENSQLAAQAFLQAVHLDPKLTAAHANLGLSYLNRGNLNEAAAQFQKAAELNPQDALPLLYLGRTRLLMKLPDAAISVLSAAQRLSPRDARISIALGEAYFTAGDARSGKASLEPICSAHESVAEPQIAASEILLHYQQPAAAQACLSPADSPAEAKILSEASRLEDQGDDQTALGILLPLKQQMQGVAAYNDVIGFAYGKTGQPAPAVAAFQKALQLDPGNEDYYLDFAQMLGDYEANGQAIQVLQWGVAAHSDSARLYEGLALAYINAKRLDEGRGAAEKAIELDPKQESAYSTFAIVCETEKDWPALLDKALRLQKLDPEDYRGWYYEALARTELPQGIQAAGSSQVVASLRRAIDLEPDFPMAHFQLGKFYLEQKNYNQATEELKRAVELKPDYLEAHFLLATAYRKAGDLPHSQEQLEIHRKLTAKVRAPQRPALEVKIEKPF